LLGQFAAGHPVELRIQGVEQSIRGCAIGLIVWAAERFERCLHHVLRAPAGFAVERRFFGH
jgi:hypothetical protein